MPFLLSLIVTVYHGLFLITPFIFTWVNSELFQFNKMLFVYLAAGLVGTLWLARMISQRAIIWKKNPVSLLALLFLAGQAASTLFSIHFRTSVFGYYSRLNGGFLSSLAYVVLLLGLINNVPKKHAFSLLLTNLVAGLLISLYAIPEHFGASPSCYLIFQEFNTNCWKQDVQARVFATFGQPNWLAAYLVALLPIAWLFAKKQTAHLKKLWLVVLGLMGLTIWYTGSRSGLLGVGVASFTWLGLHYRQNIRRKTKQFFRRSEMKFLGASLMVGVGVGLIMIIQNTLLSPSPKSYDLSQGTESGSIRLIVWQGALKVWQRYPWLGSGPGTFAYSYYQDRPAEHNLTSEWDNLYNKAHNELLNYLAETGLVGTASYLIMLGGIVWLISRRLPPKSQRPTLALATLASLTGLFTTHFFGFSTVTTNVLLFLLPGIALLEEIPTPTSKRTSLNNWQKMAFLSLALAFLLMVSGISKTWLADWHYAQSEQLQGDQSYSAALDDLQQANQLIPKEPLYYDELANLYAKLAIQYALIEDSEISQQLAEAAIQNSDYALTLNPRHLNFYKTRIRVFLLLAQTDSRYFSSAEQALQAALELSPTDAQLWYNLGVVQQSLGKFAEAVQTLQYTVEIRPNYVKARSELGDLLVQLGRVETGKKQYQFILENLSSHDEVTKQKLLDLENPAAAE